MLKAIKECMKNWLVTHERLYWYIVIGLAVLGFGIVTALGCAKLERAEAAEMKDGYISVNWRGTTQYVPVEDYDYYYVLVNGGTDGDRVFFTNTPLVVSSTGSMPTLFNYGDMVEYGVAGNDDITKTRGVRKASASGTLICVWKEYYCNVDVYTNNGVLAHFANPFPFQQLYSTDAPYVRFDSLDIYCPLATTPQTFKQNADVTDIYKDYRNWYWQYNGVIVNNSDIVPEKYALNVAFTVQLPTYDYVSELYVLSVVRQYLMPKNVPASVKEWMASDSDFEEYTFTQEFVLDVAEDGTFSLKIPYSAIHALLVYAYPDVLETFGTCTDSDIDFCDIWMAHLYVEQCNTLLTVTSGSKEYYGRSIMNIFSKGITNRAVTAEVLVDILNATDAELESAISDALKIGYDEALKQNQADMDNMQNDLDSIFEVDGAFSGNLEGTDLWSGFSNLSEGLASLGPSIKQLSSLIGSVLVFVPAPIVSIMSFTLFAICIIAIIEAIRG